MKLRSEISDSLKKQNNHLCLYCLTKSTLLKKNITFIWNRFLVIDAIWSVNNFTHGYARQMTADAAGTPSETSVAIWQACIEVGRQVDAVSKQSVLHM